MLSRDNLLDRLTVIGGMLGHVMVFMSMVAGCILLWYFVFEFIFKG